MKTYKSFVYEASKSEALKVRNDAIDIEKIVRDSAKAWTYAETTENDIKFMIDYFKSNITFSLNKLMDLSNSLSAGLAKSILEKIKKEVNNKGLGKSGTSMKTQSQADRINSYLSQRHIGPIKR
jgi:hypothetical protein